MYSKTEFEHVIQKLWAIRGSYFPHGERQAQTEAWEDILMFLEAERTKEILAQAIENENAAKAAQNFLIVLNCTITVINTKYADFSPKRSDVKKIIKNFVPPMIRLFPFRKEPGREKAIIYKNVLRKITTQEDLFV